jgi:hypothetical protein
MALIDLIHSMALLNMPKFYYLDVRKKEQTLRWVLSSFWIKCFGNIGGVYSKEPPKTKSRILGLPSS